MEILVRDEGIIIGLLHKEHAIYIRAVDREDYESIKKVLRVSIKSYVSKIETNDRKNIIKIFSKDGYKEIGSVLQQAFGL